MSESGLSRARILAVFEALSAELERRGIKGQVFVVGGAAMALAYDARRVTRDVDAVFEPKDKVYQAARAVAESEGLPDDWLNDAVKGFLPGTDGEKSVAFSTPSLEVAVASSEYLLALKLLASRVDQDTEDIRTLYDICGYSTPQEGLDLLERLYPRRKFEAKVRFLLEELFGSEPA